MSWGWTLADRIPPLLFRTATSTRTTMTGHGPNTSALTKASLGIGPCPLAWHIRRPGTPIGHADERPVRLNGRTSRDALSSRVGGPRVP